MLPRALFLAAVTAAVCVVPGACASSLMTVRDGQLARDGRLAFPSDGAVLGGWFYFAERDPREDRTIIRGVDLSSGIIRTVPYALTDTRDRVLGASAEELLLGSWNDKVSEFVWLEPTAAVARPATVTAPAPQLAARGAWPTRKGDILLESGGRLYRLGGDTGELVHVAGAGQVDESEPDTTGDGGPAVEARIAWVNDAAADAFGNIYFTQHGVRHDGSRIRRIDRESGRISTVVGPGTPVDGDPDGRRVTPYHLALDRDGDLIFDDGLSRILRLSSTAASARLITAGPRRRATFGFENVSELDVDTEGHIYVVDYVGNRIWRVASRSGRLEAVAGNGRPQYQPGFADEQVGPPPPDNERCTNELTPPSLTVEVTAEGSPLGGYIRLLRSSDVRSTGPLVPIAATVAGAGGRGTVTAPTAGYYAVLVTMEAFTSSLRHVSLSAGCSGTFRADLELADFVQIGG